MPTGGQIGKLLCLDLSLVRSKLDKCCIVYEATSKHILKKLNLIHHQSLRIAPGAVHTSSLTSLYGKVQGMSLNNRRKILSTNYIFKNE